MNPQRAEHYNDVIRERVKPERSCSNNLRKWLVRLSAVYQGIKFWHVKLCREEGKRMEKCLKIGVIFVLAILWVGKVWRVERQTVGEGLPVLFVFSILK